MSILLAVDLIPSFLTHHYVATLFAWCPGFLRSALVVNAQGRSVGSAVIAVSNPGDAQRIIQAMDGVEIAGSAIRVSRLEGPPQECGLGPLANATDEAG
jgi:RNA recognition motif-containing protein